MIAFKSLQEVDEDVNNNTWLCISLAFLIVFKDIDKAVLQINPPWVFADMLLGGSGKSRRGAV
jgi:hypothetical protein